MQTILVLGEFDVLDEATLLFFERYSSTSVELVVAVQDDRDFNILPILSLVKRMRRVYVLKGVVNVVSYRKIDIAVVAATVNVDIIAVHRSYFESFSQEIKNKLGEHGQLQFIDECGSNNSVFLKTIRTNVVSFWEGVHAQSKKFGSMLTSCDKDMVKLQQETKKELQILCKYLQLTNTVLDLGCGDGRLTLYLSSLCKLIVGVDVEPASISRLLDAQKSNVRGVVSNVCEFECAPHSYDVIILSGILPCLDVGQLRKLLRLCSHALTQEGILLVRTSISTTTQCIEVINQFSAALNSMYTAYYLTQSKLDEEMTQFSFSRTHMEKLYQNHADSQVIFCTYRRAVS